MKEYQVINKYKLLFASSIDIAFSDSNFNYVS